jgi:hypothetical protein
MKLMRSLERIENKLDKESGSSKLGSHGTLMRKEEEEVVENITNTSKNIPIREHALSQVHPMLGSIRDLKWMNLRVK